MIIKYNTGIYYWFLLSYDLKNNYADLGGYYPFWPSGSEANAWQLVPKILVMYEFSTQTIVL